MWSLQRILWQRRRSWSCPRFISWFKRKLDYDDVVAGLKETYRNKLLPLEVHTLFHELQSPQMNDADFEAKPLVLLMGQYSTGKTTMIRYMLQEDFPGMHIGPEPTTDKFIVLMHGTKKSTIPGNALVVDPNKPFAPLSRYGNAFLTKFQCSLIPSPVLEGISIVDTPGILSGEKQRVDRGYDFIGVLKWFSERVDRIILLFDANKLDISDEFRLSIEALRGNGEKIKIVLNKADSMEARSLIRVYGSLLWSLGKVLKTPEVAKVHMGSFWSQPLVHSDLRKLFEEEEHDLFTDIQTLPSNATIRKISDLSKRARQVQVHSMLMAHLYRAMPKLFGKEAKKLELVNNLPDVYESIRQKHNLSWGDFPPVDSMQVKLRDFDFSRLNAPSATLDLAVSAMLTTDISRLMAMLTDDSSTEMKDGIFNLMKDDTTPFAFKAGDGFDAGRLESGWVVNATRAAADASFDRLEAEDGKLSRTVARSELFKSGLPSGVLAQIYALSDFDKDGLLDRDEYALAQYILQLKLQGYDLPVELPSHLVPPSKRS